MKQIIEPLGISEDKRHAGFRVQSDEGEMILNVPCEQLFALSAMFQQVGGLALSLEAPDIQEPQTPVKNWKLGNGVGVVHLRFEIIEKLDYQFALPKANAQLLAHGLLEAVAAKPSSPDLQ